MLMFCNPTGFVGGQKFRMRLIERTQRSGDGQSRRFAVAGEQYRFPNAQMFEIRQHAAGFFADGIPQADRPQQASRRPQGTIPFRRLDRTPPAFADRLPYRSPLVPSANAGCPRRASVRPLPKTIRSMERATKSFQPRLAEGLRWETIAETPPPTAAEKFRTAGNVQWRSSRSRSNGRASGCSLCCSAVAIRNRRYSLEELLKSFHSEWGNAAEFHFAPRQGAGFVEGEGVDLRQAFQGVRTFDDNPRPREPGQRGHHGGGRRQHQRARAGHHQHAQRGLPAGMVRSPVTAHQLRNVARAAAKHDRQKPFRQAVGGAFGRRFRAGGLGHGFGDLPQQRFRPVRRTENVIAPNWFSVPAKTSSPG